MITKEEVFVIKDKYASAFYESFIISLFLTLTPSKALGFIIPFICIFWFIIRCNSGNSFKRFMLINCSWLVTLLLFNWYSHLIGLNFNNSNAFLSYINYASLFLIFVFPSAVSSPVYNYEKYAKLILYIILIEGCVGIMQRILVEGYRTSTFGDVVEGTINPLSFALGHSGFGNQFFAINMVFFLIFCFPYVYTQKKYRLFYLIGIIALILASVGHVFYSLLLSIVVTYVFFEGWRLLLNVKLLVILLTVISVMLLLLAKLDPGVYNASQRQLTMLLNGETPKAKAVEVVFTELGKDYPTTHLVGIGPGQYSSRAGIIASGTYDKLSDFFLNLPFLELGLSVPFEKYVLKSWNYVRNNLDAFGNSTMYRPYFSLLSVYTEFGGVIFMLMLFLVLKRIQQLKRIYHQTKSCVNTKVNKFVSLSCACAILFLFFLGLYENYFETAQGIFTGILIILLLNAMLRTPFLLIQPTNAETKANTPKLASV